VQIKCSKIKNLTLEDIELLINQAKALELVSIKKMSGDGGKPGRMLLKALKGAEHHSVNIGKTFKRPDCLAGTGKDRFEI
jgi:hypothetical protein